MLKRSLSKMNCISISKFLPTTTQTRGWQRNSDWNIFGLRSAKLTLNNCFDLGSVKLLFNFVDQLYWPYVHATEKVYLS